MVDGNDAVKLPESHQRPGLDVSREFPGVFPMENFGGLLANEAFDHLPRSVAEFGNNFKRENEASWVRNANREQAPYAACDSGLRVTRGETPAETAWSKMLQPPVTHFLSGQIVFNNAASR